MQTHKVLIICYFYSVRNSYFKLNNPSSLYIELLYYLIKMLSSTAILLICSTLKLMS